MDAIPTPTTLLEAVAAFADPQVAHDYFVAIRWPNGMACPRMGCGSADVVRIANRNLWKCHECKKQFTAKVNTVFEDSPIGFNKWLPALWLLASNRNGISSCELSRGLNVSQKAAWFMLHRLRLMMRSGTWDQLSGEVEADETYVGGKTRRFVPMARRIGKAGKKAKMDAKTVVLGMVERPRPGHAHNRVRAMVVASNRRITLAPKVLANVAAGSTLYTDSLRSYIGLQGTYEHRVINHAVAYVEGNVHTNNIENFWSVLKRTLAGTYIAARPFHLDAYLDEQVFRFNARRDSDGDRFASALKGADGRRVTWAQLTDKTDR